LPLRRAQPIAPFTNVEFAIGARRTAPLWRLLDGVPTDGWTDAIDMTGAQVTVADYCPNWWPANTRLLIRRVRLDLDRGQVSGDPRARRRRTLHPAQRALPLDDLAGMAEVDGVFAYSFIVTNLDVSTGVNAVQVEHWYRHRTTTVDFTEPAEVGHRPSSRPCGRWVTWPVWSPDPTNESLPNPGRFNPTSRT